MCLVNGAAAFVLDLGGPCFQKPLAPWESHVVTEFHRPGGVFNEGSVVLQRLEEGLELSPFLLEGQASL